MMLYNVYVSAIVVSFGLVSIFCRPVMGTKMNTGISCTSYSQNLSICVKNWNIYSPIIVEFTMSKQTDYRHCMQLKQAMIVQHAGNCMPHITCIAGPSYLWHNLQGLPACSNTLKFYRLVTGTKMNTGICCVRYRQNFCSVASNGPNLSRKLYFLYKYHGFTQGMVLVWSSISIIWCSMVLIRFH